MCIRDSVYTFLHTPEHVKYVEQEGIYEIAALAAGGAIKASEIGLIEPCFALIRPPGHHACLLYTSGVTMKILHPSSPSSDINESSIVVKITFGQVSFMLTGDVGQDSEMKILQRGYDLKSTILKVSHHGSIKGTSSSFLSAVRPNVAVIMCGKENPYGYPHDETLTKLAGARVDIYRTDIQGTIVIITDGETFKIN